MNLAGTSTYEVRRHAPVTLEASSSMDALLIIENTLLMPRLLPRIIATLYWFESINSRLYRSSAHNIILLLASGNELETPVQRHLFV